jgi:type IV pilus assembly protein PilE
MSSVAKTKAPAERRNQGFTLIEMMIVVALMGILAAIAYPSYQDSVRKTRRADAKAVLAELAQFMERTYTENNSFKPGGNIPTLPHLESPIDGSQKYYDLSISASSSTSFTLQAMPKGPQAGDGLLTLSSTGARWWDTNNNGSVDTGENSW